MARKPIIRALKWTALISLALITIVVIHVILVTRPRVDATTRVMARIDFNQTISRAEADKATAWLYRQKGVDHVLCNPTTNIAIFTYSPLTADANGIAADFRTELHYPAAKRYVPSEKEMQSGCPVASTSFVYKTCMFIKRLF